MQEEDTQPLEVEQYGEKISPEWQYRFLVLTEVPAGSIHAQAIFDNENGREIGELRTVAQDLHFASQCLKEADRLGLPDNSNTLSKALINAGIVSYGRVFKGSVRTVRVDLEEIASGIPGIDKALHQFLLDLRDKHVAHSVNEFERAVAGPLMVQPPGSPWEPRGVGAILQTSIGINRRTLLSALTHIDLLRNHVAERVAALEAIAFREFTEQFARTADFTMAPLLTFVDREGAGKRR